MSFNLNLEPNNKDKISEYVFVVFVTAVILIVACIIVSSNDDFSDLDEETHKENYVVYSERDKWRCKECSGLNRINCGNCANCGFCYDYKGKGTCVPGDQNGPFFRSDCVDYEYISPIYYTDVYPGWSYFYDGYYYEPSTGRYIRHHPKHDHDHDDDYDNDYNYNHKNDHDHNHKNNNTNNNIFPKGSDGTVGGRGNGIGPRITPGGKALGVSIKNMNEPIGTIKMGSNTGSSIRVPSTKKASILKSSNDKINNRGGEITATNKTNKTTNSINHNKNNNSKHVGKKR